ncbi:MAG: oligosaccharide flippase family protein, partial [Duncaniella sp.]|nr:oligosaccharide flippase family protein [Duncaniella sp.]
MNQLRAGAILNYVIVILNVLTGLLYTPYMLGCLGQNQYGLYSLVASVIAYLTLLDFGFGSSIVRYAAKIKATGTKEDEWRLYGMFLAGYTAIGVLVTIAGIALYFNVDRMFDRTMTPDELGQARIMMALMAGNLAITFPFSLFGSIISAYERFVFQRVVNITRILLSTAVLVCVLYMGYKAIALVVVQTVFSLGTLLANFLYCRWKLRIRLRFDNLDLCLLREVMIFSWWNFLGAIVDRIYWSTGQFILGVYCGTVAVAIYSVSITLMNLYMSMSTSVSSVLLPRVTVMAAESGRDREISDLFIRTGRLQFAVLAMILAGFIVFG